MKSVILLLTILFSFGFTQNPDCGDGHVYANQDQTGNDERFASYSKINGAPKFKGGDKKLDDEIRKNFKLAEELKNQIFNMNYQFTVTCDGKIKDVKQLGKVINNEQSNLAEILKNTEGSWTPAKKDGKPVDCIYFRTLSVIGNKY